MLNRSTFFAAVLVLPLALFIGCSSHSNPWPAGKEPKVVVTFPPLASWVDAISDGKAGVICLCTRTGPHEYQYNVKEQIGLRDADLFLSNGLGLDDKFAPTLKKNLGQDKPPLVEIGEDLPKALLLKAPEHGHEGGADHGHKHDGEYDPHVWLGIPTAKKMIENVRDQLKKAHPAGAALYDEKTREYLKKIDAMHKDGKDRLAKKDKKLITFHESLGYFAPSFGLEVVDVIEGAPGAEPTGAHMAKLVEQIKKSGARVIAVEPQYPAKTAQVLKDEMAKHDIEVELVEVDPLETEPDPAKLTGDWYLEKMKKNIDALDAALKMTDNLVTIRDLHVELGGRPILRGVDADLERGQVAALVGLNGSGKSTMLRALVKEIPYSGTIAFHCGHDHRQPAPEHVGYVPQKLRIDAYLPLTILDLFAIRLQRWRPLFLGVRTRVRRRVTDLLGRVGMSGRENSLVDKLSGGELQRVLLALALAPAPELLLLDEPAAGIDFQEDDRFYELIGDLNRATGVTVLLVSHDLSVVSKLAHQVLCLAEGRIQCRGSPREVLAGEMLAQTFGHGKMVYQHTHAHDVSGPSP